MKKLPPFQMAVQVLSGEIKFAYPLLTSIKPFFPPREISHFILESHLDLTSISLGVSSFRLWKPIQGPFRGRNMPLWATCKPLLGHFKPPQAAQNVVREGAVKGGFRLSCGPQEGAWISSPKRFIQDRFWGGGFLEGSWEQSVANWSHRVRFHISASDSVFCLEPYCTCHGRVRSVTKSRNVSRKVCREVCRKVCRKVSRKLCTMLCHFVAKDLGGETLHCPPDL